jgi:hypothetical protein
MAERALLIGSPVGELAGVETDVETMNQILATYGFAVQQCVGPAATREGILDAYNRLISDTSSEDKVVVYYSGHGARAVAAQDGGTNSLEVPAKYYQFIVPVDIDESVDDDFRGIANLELSMLMAKLTEKTKNVTVILDCCHSARMSRGIQITARALPRPWSVGAAYHLERLNAEGVDVRRLDVESNPYAVRLVAAGPGQSAYEYMNPSGQITGMFTESLRIALEESHGLPVTWAAIGSRVRNRVLSLEHTQRPEVEGPADRLLFDVQTVEQTGVIDVFVDNCKPILRGGRILGVEVGDEYAIMPLAAPKHDPANEIAAAVVTGVSGGRSRIKLEFRQGHNTVPDGARAFPIRRVLHKLPIRLQGKKDKTAILRQAIEASSHLRLLSNDDTDEALAVLDVSQSGIALLDPERRLLVAPKAFSDTAVKETENNLKRFAQAYHLRTLDSGQGPLELRLPFEVEWGIVKDGKRSPKPKDGALLYVGDSVYVRVQNQSNEKIYASVFDIGLSGKITLLNASEPSGIEVLPNEAYILGHREYYGLEGLPLKWADVIPDDGPRPESLVVIVSDQPQNVQVFEQQGMRTLSSTHESPLKLLLTQYAQGGIRDISTDTGRADVLYAVQHIDFFVSPIHRPIDDGPTFLIDERPAPGFFERSHRGVDKLPQRVAVRLEETIVHSNRALFSTEVRIDSMVITGSTAATECYHAATARFPGVKDGDRLSFDNLLIYHGPVIGFLDITVWISRDRRESLDLSDMFKEQLNASEFKEAAVVLTGMAVAAPHVATVVAAFGAAATLTSIGYKLLSAAVVNSIGLYRTSFLGHEAFGLGRHPEYGLMRAQDFSFGYNVMEV